MRLDIVLAKYWKLSMKSKILQLKFSRKTDDKQRIKQYKTDESRRKCKQYVNITGMQDGKYCFFE